MFGEFRDLLLGRAGAAASTFTPTINSITSVPYVDTRGIMGLSAVWRCVFLIADTIADMPWQEWDGLEGENPQLVDPSRLVRKPFPLRSRRWWTWRVVATEALYSTCYALHVGGYDSAGKPWSLLPVPPDMIFPINLDPTGLTLPYEYSVAGQKVSSEDLTLIERGPLPNLSENVRGLLNIARMQFGAMLAADTHAARYWNAGGPTTTVLTSDQELDKNDVALARQRWRDARAMGTDYPAVMGKGLTAQPWGADPTTDSGTEARREVNAEVARYFGVPTRIVNAPAGDSETYSNVESDAIDLYRYTLRGYAGPVEDAISSHLPGDAITGRRMIFQPERFLQGDLASRAEAYSKLVGGPIMSQDEARRRGFQLPPIAKLPPPTTATVTVTDPTQADPSTQDAVTA